MFTKKGCSEVFKLPLSWFLSNPGHISVKDDLNNTFVYSVFQRISKKKRLLNIKRFSDQNPVFLRVYSDVFDR